MSSIIDIVTVFHNEKNKKQSEELQESLSNFESDRFSFYSHSNMENNIGFAAGCNAAASLGTSPYVGMLNPDVVVFGPFIDKVVDTLSPNVVKITGMDFDKPKFEQRIWKVKNWVCGAVFFTTREWWETLGGFDERFVWSHEETDFIRHTESKGFHCQPIKLPMHHASPTDDIDVDIEYKKLNFDLSNEAYRKKWGDK